MVPHPLNLNYHYHGTHKAHFEKDPFSDLNYALHYSRVWICKVYAEKIISLQLKCQKAKMQI